MTEHGVETIVQSSENLLCGETDTPKLPLPSSPTPVPANVDCEDIRAVAVLPEGTAVACPSADPAVAKPIEGRPCQRAGLSLLDRLLPVWVLLAMVGGVLLGVYSSDARDALGGPETVHLCDVPLSVAMGLWFMMLPVLTKVRYELLGTMLRSRGFARHLVVSFTLNWGVGPATMTGLAWACLPDLPHYRNGVIMVGLARCIAMVLIWNELAGGSSEMGALLVALNSALQMVLYAPFAVAYVGPSVGISGELFWRICRSVLVFLGVPLGAGVVLRVAILRVKGQDWLEERFMKFFEPVSLVALLYIIIVFFAAQGNRVVSEVGSVARVAVPMLLYFLLLFMGSLAFCWFTAVAYPLAVTQAFTAASNNFELAIAVCAAVFGVSSQEVLAATVGALVEVPALLSLVYMVLYVERRWWGARDLARDEQQQKKQKPELELSRADSPCKPPAHSGVKDAPTSLVNVFTCSAT
eukprot:RCo009781